MRRGLALLSLIAALLVAEAATAAPVFEDNFQDGDAAGWAPIGGEVRVTDYAGNRSLRLSGRAAAVTSVSTLGYGGVTIAAAIAAQNSRRDDSCVVEVSADDGASWVRVLRVVAGQDDGVTLHTGAVSNRAWDNVARVLIGARASGGADTRCWIDNIRVAGAAAASASSRTQLTRAFLTGSAAMGALAPMQEFAPAADARAPTHQFGGVLSFDPVMAGFAARRDDFRAEADPTLRLRAPPRFDFEFVQTGDRLIPVQRGPIVSGHPSWDFALEAGRVWDEPGDSGMTRAALPFSLIESNANCTHNGVLTFLFGDGGLVSRVAWQIASETCSYLQFDAWGVATATTHAGSANASAVGAADALEQAQRMPTRPFAELALDHPGVDLSAFASPADINPVDLTTFGLVYGGVHYLGGCDTRAGPHPFCEALDIPSYSLAKTLVGAFALMRLEHLHPGAMLAPIATHVPACADWQGVSFENALDMATGRYRSAASEADENAMTGSRFFLAPGHREKIDLACTEFPRQEAPGRRWVYHTTDTYALGAAIADIWRDLHGAEADFFNELLAEGVYAPLHLSATIRATRRTLDDARQPYTGWGLTLLRDDIAKIGAYLVGQEHAGGLMAAQPLNAGLQRDPADPGLPAESDVLRYNNGFWAYNAQEPLHCADPVWIPFLSGFGGIVVALMPNGVTYYYVSDGGAYAWARAAQAAHAIAPLCARPMP